MELGLGQFLREVLVRPHQLGAIVPSSGRLARAMVAPLRYGAHALIVEAGAGTGSITRAILQCLPRHGRLYAFEVNRKFCQYLRKRFADHRLCIVNQPVETMLEILPARPTAIISSLPLMLFPERKRRMYLALFAEVLASSGVYVQFSYRPGLYRLCREYFARVDRRFVIWNLPPAWVWICTKSVNAGGVSVASADIVHLA